MKKTISATKAQRQFFALLEIAEDPDVVITITRRNHPPIVMLSKNAFEGWQETVEIMSDPELMRDIEEGMKEKGRGIPLEVIQNRFLKKSDGRASSKRRL